MSPIVIEGGEDQGYTFKELQEAFYARGFNDYEDTAAKKAQAKRWINQAYQEVCDREAWPWLETSAEEKAPLTIPNLRHVLSVTNRSTSTVLWPVDRRSVVFRDPEEDDTGTALRWYREGVETIQVWPLDTSSTLTVRYTRTVTELSADDDEPEIPSAYQELIVDGAVIRGYKARDNFEAAQFLRQEWERAITEMTHSLMHPNYDANKVVERSGLPGDYL